MLTGLGERYEAGGGLGAPVKQRKQEEREERELIERVIEST